MKVTRIVGLVLLALAVMLWMDMSVPLIDSLDAGYLSGFAGQTSLWWTQKVMSILMLPLSLWLIKR